MAVADGARTFIGAATASLLAAGLLLGAEEARAQAAMVDGDEALRCAVERAVDIALIRQLHDIAAGAPGHMEVLGALAAGTGAPAASDRFGLLQALGLVSFGDGGAVPTELGRRVAALGGAADSGASVPLALGATAELTLASPGGSAFVTLDTSGAAGETVVVLISPVPVDGDGCAAALDPVVRARLPGVDGLELVARGMGPVRTATLMLHNLPEGALVELAISDVVGAPGSFDLSAEVWPASAPAGDLAALTVEAGPGPIASRELAVDGDRVAAAIAIPEGGAPVLSIRGLAGAQPGVRVYRTDEDGDLSGQLVWESSFLPVAGATIDLAAALDPGFYAITVEELSGRPATFLLSHSGSGAGSGSRVSGTVAIGGETPQVLGSDLAFTVSESGWYAFSTWSYDEVDPVMSLSDAGGALIQESDDAAFSLHPLIIAELSPGDYRLALDGFDGRAGDVMLGAWLLEPQTLPLGTVGLPQEIANDLSRPNFNAYFVPVEGNTLVDIDVEGFGDFDSILALYDSKNMVVWNADDDGGVGFGSRIIDSFDGMAMLAVVRSYDGARGGAYAVSAVDHAQMENIEQIASVVLPGGSVVDGSLPTESAIAWFRVPASGDGGHTVVVQSETMPYLDVDLFVRRPDGFAWLAGLEGYEGVTEVGFEGAMDDVFVLVRNPSGEGSGAISVSVR